MSIDVNGRRHAPIGVAAGGQYESTRFAEPATALSRSPAAATAPHPTADPFAETLAQIEYIRNEMVQAQRRQQLANLSAAISELAPTASSFTVCRLAGYSGRTWIGRVEDSTGTSLRRMDFSDITASNHPVLDLTFAELETLVPAAISAGGEENDNGYDSRTINVALVNSADPMTGTDNPHPWPFRSSQLLVSAADAVRDSEANRVLNRLEQIRGQLPHNIKEVQIHVPHGAPKIVRLVTHGGEVVTDHKEPLVREVLELADALEKRDLRNADSIALAEQGDGTTGPGYALSLS